MSGSKKEVNYSKQKMKSRIAWIIATIFAVFWLLVALVPFVFMILNSLRKQFDMLSQGCFPHKAPNTTAPPKPNPFNCRICEASIPPNANTSG